MKLTHNNVFSQEDSFKTYMREISNLPNLSKQEEYDLIKRYREENDYHARNKLVRHHLKFVVSVAKTFNDVIIEKSINLEDLIQEGKQGLIRACDKFDMSRNYKFITYAVQWIRSNIVAFISTKLNTIELPNNIYNDYMKVLKKIETGMHIEKNEENTYHDFLCAYDMKSIFDKNNNNDEETTYLDVIADCNINDVIDTIDSSSQIEAITLKLMKNSCHDIEKKLLIDFYGIGGREALNLEKLSDKYEIGVGAVRDFLASGIRQIKRERLKLKYFNS